MNLVIDASNIRQGGGVTHLQEVLRSADLESSSFRKVTIWGPQATLDRVGKLDRVELKSHPLIEKGGWSAIWFRHRILDQVLGSETDLLWVPGGTYTGNFRPYVAMARNFLPFVKEERDRYKYSRIWLRYLFLGAAQKRTFRKAAGLIHVSRTTHDVVNAQVRLPGVRQKVVLHGLHERFFREPRVQKRFEDYTPDNPVRILYVSPIAHYKHQDKLIQAVSNLRAKGIPITVDLVGSAEKSAKKRFDGLRGQLDPREEWIRWHGLIPYAQLQSFYHDADVYVCLSSCETFGMILLEAMAAGLPILCSDRSALPEIHAGTCPSVDPEDIHAVARGIEEILRDPSLRERAAAAAFNRAQEFTWKRCAAETFQFLHSVARDEE